MSAANPAHFDSNGSNGSTAGFNVAPRPGLTEVDAYISRQATTAISRRAELVDRLTGGGWQVQDWGATLFAVLAASFEAPALLVYLPEAELEPYSLTALTMAVAGWRSSVGDAPATVKLLVGPVNPELLAAHAAELQANAVIYGYGEYSEGRPLVYLGMKGLLEVELRVKTLAKAAPGEFSEIMPAASWFIVRALDSIKSDTQEVKIDNFEDEIVSLPSDESRRLLSSVPDHSGRLARRLKQYGLKHYIFELRDSLVLQTEFRVPTVNISAIECGNFSLSGRLQLPATARARLDFHLVPDQRPERILELLKQRLVEKGLEEIEVIMLPGAHRASRTPLSDPFVKGALSAAQDAARKTPLLVPLSAKAGPLAQLKEALLNPPAIVTGLGRRARPADVRAHARLLARLLAVTAALQPEPAPDEFIFELPPELEVGEKTSLPS